jgi:hypothetical protein
MHPVVVLVVALVLVVVVLVVVVLVVVVAVVVLVVDPPPLEVVPGMPPVPCDVVPVGPCPPVPVVRSELVLVLLPVVVSSTKCGVTEQPRGEEATASAHATTHAAAISGWGWETRRGLTPTSRARSRRGRQREDRPERVAPLPAAGPPCQAGP